MTILESIIEVYSRCDAKSAANDPKLLELKEQNEEPEARRKRFHEQVERVERIKSVLEATAGIQDEDDRPSQVRFALEVFQEKVGSTDQEDNICLALIRRSYYPKWTAKQQAFFDRIVGVLTTSLDYFLSFTQRRLPGGGNPLNSDQRYLIQSVGLPDPQGNEENQLAHMLDRFLRMSKYQFRGFFYPTHEHDSRQVNQKLQDALKNSVVFIQLVQNEMFSRQYPPEPNYCFDEYNGACADEKQMVLIFANGVHPDDMIIKMAVQPKFNDWYQYMYGADCVDLRPTRIVDQSANVEFNRNLLKEKVVETVYAFRKQLFDSVPTD